MWTRNITLKSIATYLNGYIHALHDNNLIRVMQPDSFQDWITNKLDFRESTTSWTNKILAITIIGLNPKSVHWNDFNSNVTKGIHRDSIKNFYELLKTYKKDYLKHQILKEMKLIII